MTVSKMSAVFHCDVQQVWDTVTTLTDCSWRSDLSKIEVLDEKRFTEYTKDGYATQFIITASAPYKRWEFDMENDNMKGHWTGVFSCKEGKTTVDFTEDVTAKKLFMKPLVRAYLKKQQTAYIQDLKKKLGE